MHIKTTVFGALVAAALTCGSQAGATEILTSTYPNWKATTTISTIVGWDGAIPNSTYNTAAGYSLNAGSYGPIAVAGPDGSGYSLTRYQGYGPSSNLTTLGGPTDGLGSMVFTTPAAGLTAFYLSLGITGNGGPISVTLSDGEVFTVNPSVGGLSSLGLSSQTPITSFVLSTAAGSEVQLADFSAAFSNAPADTTPDTPAVEVATALMIGSGLLFIGGSRKVFSNLSAAKA